MEMTKEKIAALVKEITAEVIEAQKEAQRTVGYDDLVKAMSSFAPATTRTPVAKADRGLGAARFIRAIAAGKGDPERAAKFVTKNWGADDPMMKILEASDMDAGGVFVPTQSAGEVIELLRERAVFRSMQPTVMPMPTGSLQLPKLTGGATAHYLGESANITATEQTTGMVNLSWKKLGAIVPISNDLLRFETYGADTLVRDDTVAAMAQREDIAFIRGDGTENTPKGLLTFVPSANEFNANATVNLANVTSDVAAAILRLRNAHCRMLRVGWLWAPQTEMYLMTVRDSNGNYAFRDEMLTGKFFGFPFASTINIPITLGSGSDESEIYLVDFADMILGEANTLMVDTSSEAAYWDGTALQSAYAKDLTILRVIAHHDLGVRHDASIVRIAAVKWTV